MDNPGIVKRIKEVTNVFDIAELSRLFGLSDNAVRNWGKKNNNVNVLTVLKYFEKHHPDINVHWLITGDGKKFMTDVDVKSPQDRRYEDIGRMVELVYKRLVEG